MSRRVMSGRTRQEADVVLEEGIERTNGACAQVDLDVRRARGGAWARSRRSQAGEMHDGPGAWAARRQRLMGGDGGMSSTQTGKGRGGAERCTGLDA